MPQKDPETQKKCKVQEKCKMQKSDRKLLVVFSYYVILGTVLVFLTSLSAKKAEEIVEELNAYFLCESNGLMINPEVPNACVRLNS